MLLEMNKDTHTRIRKIETYKNFVSRLNCLICFNDVIQLCECTISQSSAAHGRFRFHWFFSLLNRLFHLNFISTNNSSYFGYSDFRRVCWIFSIFKLFDYFNVWNVFISGAPYLRSLGGDWNSRFFCIHHSLNSCDSQINQKQCKKN